MKRRLAAIVAADVVGYSRLIGVDEAGTLAAVKVVRNELIEPKVVQFGGRIVKLMGDGVLMEFSSAVDAVTFAVDMQSALAERNTEVPEERQIIYRVGINVGDVVIEDGDVFGDGVNIAARLEGEAMPGGICISNDVYRQIKGRIDHVFEDLGERTLKNIAEPVRLFVWGTGSANNSGRQLAAREPAQMSKPSIAVLPFDNMSNDPDQSYFADGIAEDVITDLSKVSGLAVIARNSSFAYRGRSLDIREISRELGVRFVLEGSVRKSAQMVRINAQLIDGVSGAHVWADRFDRNLADIFEVQDNVTRETVGALQVALTPGEVERRSERRKVDPVAYDLTLQARAAILDFTPASIEKGRQLLMSAVAIDPTLARAHAGLALANCVEYANGWNNAGAVSLKSALQQVELALAADPDEPLAYHALALTRMWMRDLEGAAKAAEKAVDLEPNFAGAMTALGSILDFAGQHERAIDFLKQALRLDPEYDLALQFLARSLFSLRRYEEAEAALRKRLLKAPNSDMSRIYLASIYGHLGRIDEARQNWRELHEINPVFDLQRLAKALPFRNAVWFDSLVAGLRAADLPV